MRQTEPLVLASGSAARLALLRGAGLEVTAMAPAVDEDAIRRALGGMSVETVAARLADAKAAHVARLTPDDLVVGADQMLVCDGSRFDKPRSMEEAQAHLRALRGQAHTLVAVACVRRGTETLWREAAHATLHMRDFSDEFLDEYLAAEGDAALASVGAYRLEGLGVHLFDRVEGEHAAILGLPLLALLAFLRRAGVLTA